MSRMRAPTLSTGQQQEVDRLLRDEFHLQALQLMENAGRALAELARRMLAGELVDRPIVVLAGVGANAGGGLAAARHLLNWGAAVQIVCSSAPERLQRAPAQQLATLQAMGAPLAWAEEGWELPPADLVIDAVIGCGLRGDPRGPARGLIQLANSSAAPVLSLDTPSGVDTDGGRVFSPSIQAATTLTLGLPKRGFAAPAAAAACGALYLADVGIPSAVYAQLGIDLPPLFTRDSIIPLHVLDQEIWIESSA